MNKQEQWTAYLDGELSDDEREAFLATLSAAEKARLEAEEGFEAHLGEALRKGPSCPDLLWKRVQRDITARAGESTIEEEERGGLPWVWGLATAAVVLVVAALATYHVRDGADDLLHVAAADTTALAATSQTDANLDAVNAFLVAHAVGVTLEPLSPENPGKNVHSRLLGARMARMGEEEVAELLFECCSEPVKVVVAKHGTRAATLLESQSGGANIQGPRRIGEYVAVMVNHPHGPPHEPGPLDFLAPRTT